MELVNVENYPYKPWGERFNNNKVDFDKIKLHNDWMDFYNSIKDSKEFKRLTKYLGHCLKTTNGKVKMYPYPDLMFFGLNATPLKNIKTVILGQDPYFKNEEYNDVIVPQAMGMSFSIPVGTKTPSSLRNIYKNLQKFEHIKNIPNHGNLESWANQGCLMLNTSLTVQHGYPNSHSKFWKPITDKLIKYISDNTDNVVFILWGGPALSKKYLIDNNKHKIIVSSHPSGLSYTKPLRGYKAFINQDHFGKINKYLKKHDKTEINW